MKNERTIIFLRINRKISCQSFICFDSVALLKSVFINFSQRKIHSGKKNSIIPNIVELRESIADFANTR
jgi:hypothetical protein